MMGYRAGAESWRATGQGLKPSFTLSPARNFSLGVRASALLCMKFVVAGRGGESQGAGEALQFRCIDFLHRELCWELCWEFCGYSL